MSHIFRNNKFIILWYLSLKNFFYIVDDIKSYYIQLHIDMEDGNFLVINTMRKICDKLLCIPKIIIAKFRVTLNYSPTKNRIFHVLPTEKTIRYCLSFISKIFISKF